MTAEQRRQFRDRVLKVHRQLGGRASAEDVWAHLRGMSTAEELEAWIAKGGIADVRAVLRSKDADTGLPVAPHVGEKYVQAELLTIDEYAWLIVDHQERGDAEHARRRAYQEACEAQHGVWLDVAEAERLIGRSA